MIDVLNFRLEESNQQKRKNIDELNRKLSAEKEKQLQNVWGNEINWYIQSKKMGRGYLFLTVNPFCFVLGFCFVSATPFNPLHQISLKLKRTKWVDVLISIRKSIFYFSWEFSHECGLPSLAIIEFFFATEFPGTLLFIRTECVICILQMIRFHYISVILFIVYENIISWDNYVLVSIYTGNSNSVIFTWILLLE